MRWNASAVVGAFRVLNSGGLFLVPDTEKGPGWGVPLLHNAAPLAFLAEQAGGGATTGDQRVLEVVPNALTSRVPLILGSAGEVTRIEDYYTEHEQGYDQESSYPLFHRRTLFVEEH
jgi:fructose-1,6-bisphosphatase